MSCLCTSFLAMPKSGVQLKLKQEQSITRTMSQNALEGQLLNKNTGVLRSIPLGGLTVMRLLNIGDNGYKTEACCRRARLTTTTLIRCFNRTNIKRSNLKT